MEVEMKVKLNSEDMTFLQMRLCELNIELDKPKLQNDIYYKPQLRNDSLVRIRYTEENTTLNFKKKTENNGVWEEAETEIKEGDIAELIIQELGATHLVSVEKYRSEGMYNGIEVLIDRITSLGDYLEIAINNAYNPVLANKKLYQILDLLNIDKSKVELRSYPELVLEALNGKDK